MDNLKFNIKVIGVLFNPQEKKILVGKNKGEKLFSFVDGKLKYDEELDQSLKRIIKEKTGYEVHNLGTIYANNRINGENTDSIELFFLCEIEQGKEKLGENVEEIRWIKAEEFEELSQRKLPKRLQEYLKNICG